MSEFNKISLDMWEIVIDKALKKLQINSMHEDVFGFPQDAKSLIIKDLVKEFSQGNRSIKLYENLRKYTS